MYVFSDFIDHFLFNMDWYDDMNYELAVFYLIYVICFIEFDQVFSCWKSDK